MKRLTPYMELMIIGIGGILIIGGSMWQSTTGFSAQTEGVFQTYLIFNILVVTLMGTALYGVWVKRKVKIKIRDEQYVKLYVDNPQPMYIYDEDSLRFLSVNRATVEVYGFTEEEFLNMTLRDIRPPKERTRLDMLLSHNDPNVKRNGIWHHQTRSGQLRAVSITSDEIRFGRSKARLVQATNVDDLVRNEARIQELNQLLTEFRFAIERATMVATIDEEGKYIEVNENLVRATGYDRPFLLNQPFSLTLQTLNDASPQVQFSQVLTNLQEHHIWKGQLCHTSQKGDEFWTQAYFVPFHHSHTGRLGHAILIMTDITDQKRSEEAIRNREAYLSSLIESQSSFLIRINKEGKFTFVNQSFANQFEEKPFDFLGKSYTKFVVEAQVEEFKEARQKCIDFPATMIPLKLEMQDKLGNTCYTEWEFLGIQDDTGQVVEIQGIGKDITEKVKGEQHIMSQNRRLQEIAWISSHELRRPVANILGLIHLLTHEPQVPAELVDPLSISAEQLDDIIRTIVQKSYDIGLSDEPSKGGTNE